MNIHISGSGGSCGASGNSLYCGQALNSVNEVLVAYQTPICDCTTPFAVNIVTGDKILIVQFLRPQSPNLLWRTQLESFELLSSQLETLFQLLAESPLLTSLVSS